MADDPLQLEQFLCFATYAAGHAFNHAYKKVLDELGLTYPQYLVMVVLWQEDAQTVGNIGEKLFLGTSTLTPLLKRMEAAGYVRRVRDSKDERVVRVTLSERGHALRSKAAAVPAGILQATGMDAAKLKTMLAELNAVREALLASTDQANQPT